jgi:hypothetical protein
MIMHKEKSRLIRNCGGKTIAGKLQSGGREREQERKEKE